MTTYRFEVHIPDAGDNAPAEGMPTQAEVADSLDRIFRFEDAIPWYGEVREAEGANPEAEERVITEYGVTWATVDHPIAQTGYVFPSIEAAVAAAKRGPRAVERAGTGVDEMCAHGHRFGKLYARVETEHDTVKEVRAR